MPLPHETLKNVRLSANTRESEFQLKKMRGVKPCTGRRAGLAPLTYGHREWSTTDCVSFRK